MIQNSCTQMAQRWAESAWSLQTAHVSFSIHWACQCDIFTVNGTRSNHFTVHISTCLKPTVSGSLHSAVSFLVASELAAVHTSGAPPQREQHVSSNITARRLICRLQLLLLVGAQLWSLEAACVVKNFVCPATVPFIRKECKFSYEHFEF